MEEKNIDERETFKDIETENEKPKKAIKWTLIIPIIFVIIIILIIIIIIMIKIYKSENNKCNIGDENGCLTYHGVECASCNYRYILFDGSCIPNFSFWATYEIDSEYENINLFYNISIDDIIEMEIDKKKLALAIFIVLEIKENILYI